MSIAYFKASQCVDRDGFGINSFYLFFESIQLLLTYASIFYNLKLNSNQPPAHYIIISM